MAACKLERTDGTYKRQPSSVEHNVGGSDAWYRHPEGAEVLDVLRALCEGASRVQAGKAG